MEVVHERCCGLDAHKQTIVACVIVPGGRLPHTEVRTFGTMTVNLLELVDWLTSCQVTHVAMESTGVYWQVSWNLLEGPGRAAAGERTSCQTGARSQDRRARLRVA